MLHIATLLFVAIVAAVLLVVQPYPILHDYPEWMYQGHIAYALLTDSNSSLTALFEWVPAPVPNAISQLALAALNFVVSPVMAGKIWLGLFCLLAATVGILVAKFHQRGFEQSGSDQGHTHRYDGTISFLFMVTIAFGPGFWNGYINFQFGLILFALFFVTEMRQSILMVLLFSVLIYFSHASVFAGFICYIVIAEKADEQRPGVAFALLPSLGLLMWYTSVKLLAGGGQNVGLGSIPQWVQYKLYTLAKQGPFHNFIRPDGESLLAPIDSLYKLGFAINFIVAGVLGVWVLIILWRTKVGRVDQFGALGKGLLGTIIVLTVGWLLAGKNSFGVVNLGERFLIVALMLLILCAQCPVWLRRCWLALCAVMAVVTVGSLFVISNIEEKSYLVDHKANSTDLTKFVDDIYANSRHKYFNHRLFIYANLGQYLTEPTGPPPLVDHESSIVRIR